MALLDVSRSPAASPAAASSWSRWLHFGLLATSPGAASVRFRRLRTSAILLGVSAVLSTWLLAAWGAADAADVVALRLLGYASWLYGALGLSALLHADASWARDVSALRGRDAADVRARAIGIAVRIAAGVFLSALPGLLLALLVASSHHTLTRLALLPLSFAYAVALGASLGAIGVFSQRTWPRSPRAAAAVLVLGPYFLSLLWPGVPNLPGLFGRFLADMIRLGGDVGS